jgi:Flp pilus assembly protein TadB
VLYSTLLGGVLLAVMAVLLLVGIVWMNKVAKVDI